jgi:hypothetical protein
MAGLRFFDVHRTWEDWIGLLLGIVIAATPWITGTVGNDPVTWNAVVVGAIVIGLALLQMVNLQIWEESLELLCGLWLMASPFTFAYGGTLRTWHLVLGAVVALLALLELFQDWNRTDDELAHHGQ